jgi:drug/metabolite transporter (DMT)-like permease
MVVIFGRMAVGSVFAIAFARGLKGNTWRIGDLKFLALMILCEPCLYFLLEAKAIANTTASQAGMVTAILPLIVAVAAAVFLKERVTKKTAIGLVVAVSGVCLLSVGGVPSENAPHPAWGNFLEFLAMLCAAGYTVTLKKLTARYSPFFLTALQAFAGTVFYLPVMLLSDAPLPAEFVTVPALSIVYLGFFVTIGAYGLYNFGVSRIPASKASAFVNLIPVFTVFLGWLILGETFTQLQYLASLLVFIGIFLSQGRTSAGVASGKDQTACPELRTSQEQ